MFAVAAFHRHKTPPDVHRRDGALGWRRAFVGRARRVYRLSRLVGAVDVGGRAPAGMSLPVVRVAMADADGQAGAGMSGCGWGSSGSNGSSGIDSGIGAAG